MNVRPHWLRIMSLSLLVIAAASGAQAQVDSYPTRPVRVISDSAPGSSVDVTLRLVADRLSQAWGQQVLAVNQPGAGGAISARAAAEAVPDGYTLYMPALSVFLATPGRAANLPLELPRDFTPIGSVSEQPMFIAVAPSLGVATLPELIALAKQRPGELSYAATGVGRLTHLTGELLQSRAGIKLLLVPYSGGPTHALNDVLGGRIPVIIEAYAGIAGAVQAGKVKPIAIGGAKRLPNFPDRSDGGGDAARLQRRGLAGPARAQRHAGAHPRQGGRRSAPCPRRARGRQTAHEPRRLSQPDVAGRGHRVRAGPTAHVESAAAAVLRPAEVSRTQRSVPLIRAVRRNTILRTPA